MIMRSGKPDVMPDKIVDELRHREYKGIIDLLPEFQKGDKVDLVNCAFSGWHGIVSETSAGQRVRVLLEMLGQAVPVTVSRKNVIMAA